MILDEGLKLMAALFAYGSPPDHLTLPGRPAASGKASKRRTKGSTGTGKTKQTRLPSRRVVALRQREAKQQKSDPEEETIDLTAGAVDKDDHDKRTRSVFQLGRMLFRSGRMTVYEHIEVATFAILFTVQFMYLCLCIASCLVDTRVNYIIVHTSCRVTGQGKTA